MTTSLCSRVPRLFAAAALCASVALAAAQPGAARVPSTELRVSGAVVKPLRLDLAALQALPSSRVEAGGKAWTGVRLWTLLHDVAGLVGDPAAHNPALALAVVVTGTDGYRVVFSAGELDPAFGNQGDLVAWAVDGAPLGAGGVARLVVPGDGKGGRQVSNVASIEVVSLR